MKIVSQTICWTLLLLGGALVVSKVTYHTGLPGSGAGVGSFSYWFRYTLEPHSAEVLDDELIGFVKIEGKAPRRFMSRGGRSPKYEEVSMEWAMFSGVHGGKTEGTCSVDLNNKQIIDGANRIPLGQSSLRSLIGLEVHSEQSVQLLNGIHSKLEAAALGAMPRPRHHTYYFEEPLTRGRLQHFALGSSARFPVLIWAGIWLILLLAAFIIKKATRRMHSTFTRYAPSGSDARR